jgi:hypothetical protein
MNNPRRMQGRHIARLVAAMLYVVCILAPHVALAIGKAGAHCMGGNASYTQSDSDLAAPHAHADDAVHQHPETPPLANMPDGDPASICCGLFCVAGLTATPGLTPSVVAVASRMEGEFHYSLAGLGPDRIIRPPKA